MKMTALAGDRRVHPLDLPRRRLGHSEEAHPGGYFLGEAPPRPEQEDAQRIVRLPAWLVGKETAQPAARLADTEPALPRPLVHYLPRERPLTLAAAARRRAHVLFGQPPHSLSGRGPGPSFAPAGPHPQATV